MKISLVGYMGSGKTHISKLLSKKLNFELIDLDKKIISHSEMSIEEIFKNKGEIYFRKTEHALLKEVLDTPNSSVISVGGGTPAYYNNMDLLTEKTTSFFLRTSVTTLSERLLLNKNKRPLIANIDNEDLPEFIAKHLFERNAFYNKAQHTIDTTGKTPEEIRDEIIGCLFL